MSSADEVVRALLDSTPDAVVIVDPDGRIDFVSGRAESLFGYRRGDLVGQNVDILVPTRLREPRLQHRKAYALDPRARNVGETREIKARHSDGSEFSIEIRLTPIQSDARSLVLGSIRTIVANRRVSTKTILLLEGNSANADLYCETLTSASNGAYTIERLTNCADAVRRLGQDRYTPLAAILIDLVPVDGRRVVKFDSVFRAAGKTPILILCDSATEIQAKQALRLGANDYLVKDHLDGRLLVNAIAHLIEHPLDCNSVFDEREIAHITLNAIEDAVISCNLEGRVIYVNPVAETITGWSQAEALNRPLGEVLRLIDSHSREEIHDPLRMVRSADGSAAPPVECLVIRRGGVELGVENSTAPIYDRRGRLVGAAIVLHDVSTAHAIAARMTYLAEHDVLTGLPNRLMLSNRLPQVIAIAERHRRKVALLFLDLDYFKNVNDSMGHLIGDALLKEVAIRLKSAVRASDTVCRLSGDEFVVLLSEIADPTDAVRCADMIIEALRAPFDLGAQSISLTASIGISVCPDHGNDAVTLLRRADKALFRVKSNGRNHAELSELTGTFQKVEWDKAERRLATVIEPSPK